ncbi:MaoC/PaaZ C-terminal domain-containing protein [Rhodococcus sp. T2V]|uniref:MaoC/PaaZ C-terminal domain-containing protein n=1 Tax=Rhodococcus sp. T2V TaxID=3034164 RepID=UPI0023E2FBE1|nr:MaoC/PaaZ C-terminal domain-containing protein [Rhodococcus sp. T2V]MDF3308222.1 MaoC/PaaZ C-terminal domain-containing protein [Rhodococcus sp. T2V]
MKMTDWVGCELGTRLVRYREEDAILYALAVGARADELQLVFERDLKVLPTYALTLGLWVADAASEAGAFVPAQALHGAQSLTMYSPLPRATAFEVTGHIEAVRDTGKSAILDIVAESDYFSATYSIILPGRGGFSTPSAGTSKTVGRQGAAELEGMLCVELPPERAVLYRLTGDRHLIHVDPAAAQAAGFARPILHGLCTLGTVAKALAGPLGRQPWELSAIEARFAAPVYPGSKLDVAMEVSSAEGEAGTAYAASVDGIGVLTGGQVRYLDCD